jgi:hypothetical protein
MMKKLVYSILLSVFAAASINADTATVTSQVRLKSLATDSDMESIVAQEVAKLKREYTVIEIKRDTRSENSWGQYIVNLAYNYRTWYKDDIGALYRTNLVSNTGRKYVIFTCLDNATYETDTLRVVRINRSLTAVFEIQ